MEDMERRNTIQRKLVLDAVQNLDHPDAEQVYQEIAAKHPHISKATVYRNLNLLADQNEIQKIETGNGPDKFDFRIREHYHLRCRVCGKLIDTDIPVPDYGSEPLQENGFTIERINLEFIGICSECKNKKR